MNPNRNRTLRPPSTAPGLQAHLQQAQNLQGERGWSVPTNRGRGGPFGPAIRRQRRPFGRTFRRNEESFGPNQRGAFGSTFRRYEESFGPAMRRQRAPFGRTIRGHGLSPGRPVRSPFGRTMRGYGDSMEPSIRGPRELLGRTFRGNAVSFGPHIRAPFGRTIMGNGALFRPHIRAPFGRFMRGYGEPNVTGMVVRTNMRYGESFRPIVSRRRRPFGPAGSRQGVWIHFHVRRQRVLPYIPRPPTPFYLFTRSILSLLSDQSQFEFRRYLQFLMEPGSINPISRSDSPRNLHMEQGSWEY